MDIGRAFAFVFDDAEWVKKILIGGLISLIPLIGGFVVYGYMLEIARRVFYAGGEELPEWDDFGGYLTRGFLFYIGLLVWFLPIILLISCVATALILSGSATGDDVIATSLGLAACGLFGVMFLVIMLWAVIFMPVIAGRYAIERRFGAMFQFSEIMAEIRQAGAAPILILFVTCLAASFVGQFGVILCFIGVIFTSFYSYLVIAHGAGQVYRRARGLPETPQPTPAVAF